MKGRKKRKRTPPTWNILHNSIMKKNRALTLELIQNNTTDINEKGVEGWRALHIASYDPEDDSELVSLLLTHGARVNSITGTQGITALFVAAQQNNIKVAQKLLSHPSINVNCLTHERATPLFVAAEHGHVDMVQLLLRHNADVNLADKDYQTPLYIAATRKQHKVVELLLEHKADPNVKSRHQSNALLAATWNHDLQMLKLLLSYNATVTSESGSLNAIILCSYLNHVTALEILLRSITNKDVLKNTYNNFTALEWANLLCHEKCVRLLQ